MRKPVVLIVCTGNSCRSQMAEGLLRQLAGHVVDVQSAGTEPQDRVHPLAVEVMSEIGIDISSQVPKSVREFLGRSPVRHLIIVCDSANQSCPRIWPGVATRTYMPFEDPAGFQGTEPQKLDKFREIRDQIDAQLRDWVQQYTQTIQQR